MTVVAVDGEEETLHVGIRFHGELNGGVGEVDIEPGYRAVVLVLFVEGVVLFAGGDTVFNDPGATGGAATIVFLGGEGGGVGQLGPQGRQGRERERG